MERACRSVAFAVAAICIASSFATARNFTLQQEVRGQDFFSYFYWWNYHDPTNGFVDYVSKSESQSRGLAYVNRDGNFVMQVDNTTSISPNSNQGRKSVRLHSNDLMGDGIILAKINWMPQGCATWPAFWTCTAGNWPAGGEIDIVEGANDQGPRNLASLHTTSGCSIPSGQGSTSNRNDSGTSYNADCTNQPGCSVGFSAQNSFGPEFNRNGGGYFAMVRDTAPGGRGISVHFWPATAGNNTPAALLNPPLSYLSTFANTSSPAYSTQSTQWSNPAAHFPNSDSCKMENYFGRHNIIFDTTLCGYWAGETFPYVSGCPKNITCEDYVRGNPSAFSDARFEVEYLRIYTDAVARLSPSIISVFCIATLSFAITAYM